MSLSALLHFRLRRKGFVSREIPAGGFNMHYYAREGSASLPTIVLVHGIGTEANHFHDVLVALDRQGFPLIVPDLPGHGRSSETHEPMTAQSIYDCFASGLDRVAPPRFVLFGNSMGGALSMLYAARNPERVMGLMLASPAAGFGSQEEWERFAPILEVTDTAKADVFLQRIFHKKPFYLPLLRKPFMRALNRPSVRQMLESMRYSDISAPPGHTPYPGPTLLVWGKSENLFPRSNLANLRPLLAPGAVIEEPEGIGHCPQLDQPRWFVERLARFARECAG